MAELWHSSVRTCKPPTSSFCVVPHPLSFLSLFISFLCPPSCVPPPHSLSSVSLFILLILCPSFSFFCIPLHPPSASLVLFAFFCIRFHPPPPVSLITPSDCLRSRPLIKIVFRNRFRRFIFRNKFKSLCTKNSFLIIHVRWFVLGFSMLTKPSC